MQRLPLASWAPLQAVSVAMVRQIDFTAAAFAWTPDNHV
jgi:hypothetical protein